MHSTTHNHLMDRAFILLSNAFAWTSGVLLLQILAGIGTLIFLGLGIRLRQLEIRHKQQQIDKENVD